MLSWTGLTVAEADRIRQSIADSVATTPEVVGCDIFFTEDREWPAATMG